MYKLVRGNRIGKEISLAKKWTRLAKNGVGEDGMVTGLTCT